MAHGIQIYVTREDLAELLKHVEDDRPIQYVQTGLFESKSPIVFTSAESIDGLGIAKVGASVSEPSYLVMDSDRRVNVRRVPQRRSGVLYAIDQEKNPDTVVLNCGGEYRDEALISSEISTIWDGEVSDSLFNLFKKYIRREFQRVQSYYLGPGAVRALDSGVRLTYNMRAPEIYDLRRP